MEEAAFVSLEKTYEAFPSWFSQSEVIWRLCSDSGFIDNHFLRFLLRIRVLFRAGGFLFTFVVPVVCFLILAVGFAGWLQIQIWKRLLKQPDANPTGMPFFELLLRTYIVGLIMSVLSAGIGGKLCEIRAERICGDCTPLIADLETEKKLHGLYPTNATSLVRSNVPLRRKYFFYYGQPSTNGVEWSVDSTAKANISLFVTTNSFQFIVPIEKMSPISFSSFYVFSYSSEHPFWNKTLLHWFLGGAFIDEPKQ